jgi:glutamate dehydrogenase
MVLAKMLFAVQCTLRTNFFNEDRYALSMRMDPRVMATGNIGVTADKPLPFGVFFVHGRHFNAFHNRFRDIARGGLRIVSPTNSDQFALESSRQYDEVYGLSHAQQLKNKDIPEGGAKGVILVNTPIIEAAARPFAMRKAVKAFTDSMLDLIVKSSVDNLVDFYKQDELIYFGPDEQIIPYDIDWIVKRAAKRGYPLPAALMSSKADNGINHKDYGVTSEGVAVYLDVALRRSLGINPNKDPFTIKVTGGPDGDVAGNLINILFRDYGNNARVVGVADGFGVAEDPEGLNREELLRLVKASLPITSFDVSKLSKKGIMMTANNEEGIIRRNTMHNRVKSDAFVPAGGRPETIHKDNWRQFLDEKGVPSSKLIVEGANIFITPEARVGLFTEGKVAIVKDSSANKVRIEYH